MISRKGFLTLALPLALSACGHDGSDSGGLQKLANPFPGVLKELPPDYKPRGLVHRQLDLDGAHFAEMDFLFQSVTLDFDVRAGKAVGRSVIAFEMEEAAHPIFFLDAAIHEIKINGQTAAHRVLPLPGTEAHAAGLETEIEAHRLTFMEIEYEIAPGKIKFENGGVGFLTSMTDLYGHFIERWIPAGFENDQFSLVLKLRAPEATGPHLLFANGSARELGAHEWEITFPAHYTASSFYVHLTNKPLHVRHFSVQTRNGPIPVTVYGASAGPVDEAAAALPQLFASIESEFGPYPHDSFTAYINGSGGGMEYVAGTITSVGSLSHELFHSWFARGVMPAEGRSGWIDEAAASWRDYGFRRAAAVLQRAPTGLAGYSEFNPATAHNCYRDGRALFAELDLLAADFGGMKSVLGVMNERYRYRVLTNDEFAEFFKQLTLIDIHELMERYVYGAPPEVSGTVHRKRESAHPLPLTEAEAEGLR